MAASIIVRMGKERLVTSSCDENPIGFAVNSCTIIRSGDGRKAWWYHRIVSEFFLPVPWSLFLTRWYEYSLHYEILGVFVVSPFPKRFITSRQFECVGRFL